MFHQAFKNFQLNTFNGASYLVQNDQQLCKTDLGGLPIAITRRRSRPRPGACAPGDTRSRA